MVGSICGNGSICVRRFVKGVFFFLLCVCCFVKSSVQSAGKGNVSDDISRVFPFSVLVALTNSRFKVPEPEILYQIVFAGRLLPYPFSSNFRL